MLLEIQQMAKQSEHYTGIAEISTEVAQVLLDVDRSQFVPANAEYAAYENRPLEIGHGQTISQPFIVALMTEVLEVKDTDKVLEIGTGSGYQAAVLGKLAGQVFSIEIVDELAAEAAERLNRLGFANVAVKAGDGWFGWPDEAPFDSIIITAVTPKLPPQLVEQLRVGGSMVLPIGGTYTYQELVILKKLDDGETEQRVLLPVRFVPMTGEASEH